MTTTKSEQIQFRTNGVRITWMCNGCGEPIRRGTGYLEADDNEAYRQWRDSLERERARDPWKPINIGELLALPDPAPWLAWHRKCDPAPDVNGYWIAVERINTLPRLIHWAGHLMGKGWIEETDWRELLERIGEYA